MGKPQYFCSNQRALGGLPLASRFMPVSVKAWRTAHSPRWCPCCCRNSRACLWHVEETIHIKMFVFDETSEMLSRGFKDQISMTYSSFFHWRSKSGCLLSNNATRSSWDHKEVREQASEKLRILVKRDELTLEGRVETRDTLRSLGVSSSWTL